MPRPRSEAMFALIRQYLGGPTINQREFCRTHQIAYSTFHLYLKKYRQQHPVPKQESGGRFVPLTVPDLAIPSGSHSECEMIWPDGVIIRFETKPSPEYLLALIGAGPSRR